MAHYRINNTDPNSDHTPTIYSSLNDAIFDCPNGMDVERQVDNGWVSVENIRRQ